MTKQSVRIAMLALASGTTLTIGSMANAQAVINVEGATLFENFFKAPASTIDYFDADGDGHCKTCPGNELDQLAKFSLPPAYTTDQTAAGQFWVVQYFESGSVQGLQDLVSYGYPNAQVTDGEAGLLNINTLSKAWHNRQQYFGSGAGATGIRNAGNPFGAPCRQDSLLNATYSGPPNASSGGFTTDIAVSDVPSFWGARVAGSSSFAKLPGQAGYGTNPALPLNTDGTTAVSSQQMVDLGSRLLFDPNNPPPSNSANTIFDTQIAAVPVAVLVNYGVGRSTIKQSELRHLNATGRMPSGENLTMITRESGSGTRNLVCNSIGLDPSFGVGENVGNTHNTTNTALARCGASFLPSNQTGSGDLENTIFNTRLGLGYTGAERYANNGLANKIDILGVQFDLAGGSSPVRPTSATIAHNDPATGGYAIFGAESFLTIGDPLAAPVVNGGSLSHASLPAMNNVQAAAFINNITLSLAGFDSNPNADSNTQTPGENIGINFVAIAALDKTHDLANPTSLIANNVFNTNVQSYFTTSTSVVYNKPANAPYYANFGQGGVDGVIPFRVSGVTYSDGVVGGGNYKDQNGNAIAYGGTFSNGRNRVCGDFNGDGKRNVNDITDMVKAYVQRSGGAVWVAPGGPGGSSGGQACIELLGDFNNDGNFDKKDLRYFADGLATDPVTGLLNRKLGFTQIDAAFGGNLFGTTKATGVSYNNGDSRADIAGPSGRETPGYAPIGADGVIDGYDIDYVTRQFKRNPNVADGALNWDNTAEAIGGDLSADINGDRVIDKNDVCELVRNVLGTTFGDVNLDGVVNCADVALVTAHLGQPGGWAQGDMNGDGVINSADLAIVRSGALPGDANGDGIVNTIDLGLVLSKFGQAVECDDLLNINGGGSVNTITLGAVLSHFGQTLSCP